MSQFKETKILPYKAQEIFDLVMDIEKYPEFLPWCKNARIVNQVFDDNLQADLLISFKAFTEKYRSNVVYYKNEDVDYVVESRAIEGPFKVLFSRWVVKKVFDNSCEIEFEIEFEFSSKILQTMIGFIFEKAAQKMMDSFEKRAKELYS